MRSRHDLSPAILADILGLKNKVTISKMETGSTMPQYNTIIEISDLFGVSLDWLTGRSTEQYNVDTIEKIEDYLLDVSKHLNVRDTPDLIYLYYVCHMELEIQKYYDLRNEFTLEERADVIYALSFWCYASHRLHEEGFDSQRTTLYSALEEIDGYNDEEPSNAAIHQILGVLAKHLHSYHEQIQFLSEKCSSKRAGNIFASQCKYCIAILHDAYEKCKVIPIRKSLPINQQNNS